MTKYPSWWFDVYKVKLKSQLGVFVKFFGLFRMYELHLGWIWFIKCFHFTSIFLIPKLRVWIFTIFWTLQYKTCFFYHLLFYSSKTIRLVRKFRICSFGIGWLIAWAITCSRHRNHQNIRILQKKFSKFYLFFVFCLIFLRRILKSL